MNNYNKTKEHLARAAEMLRKKKEEEEIADQKYYEKVTTGTSWLIFKIGVIFCLVLNVLITIDFFVDGETKPLPVGSYEFDRPTHRRINTIVWVGDDIFTPHYKAFVSVDYNSFTLTYSKIFNKAKYISFDAHTLDNRQRFYAYERISIFDSFPWTQLLLLIPLLVFIFKRKSKWFNFFRIACLFLIYPGTLIIILYLI